MLNEGIFLGQRYEILGRIGAGGMADVYKGRDTKLNRYVAIKILKREFGEDETFVKKFKVEAQSAAGLMHPNIVNVYDVGEDKGYNYMVMELVEGITLKDYIQKKGKLSAKEVISITIQIANGIDAAHSHQIIHRDIKPQNVIISKEGKVKVTDFGIAKATTSNTISSNAMGSVHYTSPEQARGGFSDAKSDIYSTGITMYEMITGQVPFDGDATVTIAIKHLQEEIIPPSELVHNIPYSLEQIILKCTQKSPDRRYQNMSELLLDLKRSLVDPEGDFVVIAPFVKNTETVVLSEKELDDISHQGGYDDEYDDDDDNYDDDDDDDNYDDDDDNYKDDIDPKMKKISKTLKIVVAVIIAFILIFVIAKATGVLKFGPSTTTNKTVSDKVTVPNIVGMTETVATDALKKKSLGINVVTREESEKYDAGLISSQKTAANTKVKKNTTIDVVVSSGKKGDKITVPDLTNQSEEDAKKALKELKLKSDSTFDYSDDIVEGNVISTTPVAGSTVKSESSVTLIISKGAQKATVPNLVGQSQDAAIAALQNANLNPGNITSEDNSQPAGTVLSQGLKSGKQVEKGTSVDFVVSKGPKEVLISVPQLVGLSQNEAEKALTDKGLVPSVSTQSSANVTEGFVISTSHSQGTQVSAGTTVEIIISTGPEQTTPPSGNPGNSGN